MKKLVFTIQVVALIAFFPVYLVAELSQEKTAAHANNPVSVMEQTAQKNNVQVNPVDADIYTGGFGHD